MDHSPLALTHETGPRGGMVMGPTRGGMMMSHTRGGLMMSPTRGRVKSFALGEVKYQARDEGQGVPPHGPASREAGPPLGTASREE